MRLFVTGATGFVGGRVARQLRQAGHEVVALVRNPNRAGDLAALGVMLAPGDVTEPATLKVMAGCDGVFHIAAWYKVGEGDKSQAERINVDGTRNVLNAIREFAIPRGVYTSTVAVYSDTHHRMVDETYRFTGRHLTEYDRTKAMAHYDIAWPMMRAGLPLVIVLPGLVYGPGDTSRVRTTFINYLQRRLPLIPLGTEYCWAHVDDIAAGHILAMERGRVGEDYIIAGPRHSLLDALQLAERITGVPAPRIRLRPTWMKAMSGVMNLVSTFATLPVDIHPESLRTTAGVSYLGDNAKARRELGYNPRELETGLRETLLHEMQLLGMSVPA